MNPVLFGLFVVSGFFAVLIVLGGVHKVEEGHIGVYFRTGALLSGTTEPGINFKLPILTRYEPVQITMQTDRVTNIPCGTSGGVVISFERIEVVNRLKKELAWETIKNYTANYDKTWIFDKIQYNQLNSHEINQFCSKHTLQEVYIDLFDKLDEGLKEALQKGCEVWAPGIEVIAVRVTKPVIPAAIKNSFEKREQERTGYLMAKEQQRVKEQEAQTDKIMKKLIAETDSAVASINMEIELFEKGAKQQIESIENQIYINNKRAKTEAEKYRRLKEIEVNLKKLSENYIKLKTMQNIKNYPKKYFGLSIPDFIEENLKGFALNNSNLSQLKCVS